MEALKTSQGADAHSHLVRPDSMEWQKTSFPGCEAKTLLFDRRTGLMTALMRFAPGAVLPDHEHVGIEQTYVLEGSLVDKEGPAQGLECKAGEFVWREQGSRHVAWSPAGGLMLAIFQVPNKFFAADGRVIDVAGQRLGRDMGAYKNLGAHKKGLRANLDPQLMSLCEPGMAISTSHRGRFPISTSKATFHLVRPLPAVLSPKPAPPPAQRSCPSARAPVPTAAPASDMRRSRSRSYPRRSSQSSPMRGSPAAAPLCRAAAMARGAGCRRERRFAEISEDRACGGLEARGEAEACADGAPGGQADEDAA